jgi:hypothetical protein
LPDRLEAGVVLRGGWFRTESHSKVRNTDAVHSGAVEWQARVCRDRRSGLADYLDDPPVTTAAPTYRSPRDRQTLRPLAKLEGNFVREPWRSTVLADGGRHTLIDSKWRRVVPPARRAQLAAKLSQRDTSTGRFGQG